jgi:hypothetical protein
VPATRSGLGAVWLKFAGDNGSRWWLRPKNIQDGEGHIQLENARYIVPFAPPTRPAVAMGVTEDYCTALYDVSGSPYMTRRLFCWRTSDLRALR